VGIKTSLVSEDENLERLSKHIISIFFQLYIKFLLLLATFHRWCHIRVMVIRVLLILFDVITVLQLEYMRVLLSLRF
jgi:hypothetical protein